MSYKNSKKNKVFLFFIVFLLVILFSLISVLIVLLREKNNSESVSVTINTQNEIKEEARTIKDIIEKYDSTYIKEEGYIIISIYANFKYDLFDQNGNSNEDFFNNIIKEIVYLKKCNIYLIDEEKSIKIFVKYDEDTGEYTVKYNNVEDFYNNMDGSLYVNLNNEIIAKKQKMFITASELVTLIVSNMEESSIKLGDGIDVGHGYFSYKDGTILTRNFNKRVRNIVYRNGYNEKITTSVSIGDSLDSIAEKYPNYAFGSVREGYLGYRTDDIYIFFYEDEVSAYGYSYFSNDQFESYLEEYLSDKDLKKFAYNVRFIWSNYTKY